jgi:hypothetical protein
MHSAPCTKTSSSMSGHSWRISATSSSDSSRDRMMRADAQLAPEAHGREVDRVGLHREMHRHFRPGFANHVDQPGVGHDQRVRLERHDRRHVGQVGTHLGVVRQDVADHVQFLAGGVRFGDGSGQRVEIAEGVVAHAQAVARLAGIDGIGAVGEGRAQHRQRTGRSEQFGSAVGAKQGSRQRWQESGEGA